MTIYLIDKQYIDDVEEVRLKLWEVLGDNNPLISELSEPLHRLTHTRHDELRNIKLIKECYNCKHSEKTFKEDPCTECDELSQWEVK